jgi:copper transport protein
VKRLAVLLAVASLASPAAASAHATLLRTVPANGAILAVAPHRVTVVFDDAVRVGPGNAGIANNSRRSVLAGPPVAHGHALVLPLRRGLRNGDYSIRWSIVSDDGHLERGVLAFGVGAGGAPPTVALTASTSVTWSSAVEHWLYLFGLLTAGGVAVFGLRMRAVLGRRLNVPLAQLLFASLLVAFVGASLLLRAATSGTRYERVLSIAVVVALAGAATAAIAPLYPRLLQAATASALALLAAPTLAGHALDPDQPHWLSVPADLAHVAAAAVWIGGLVSLVAVLPRVTAARAERERVVRRFSGVALVTVCVLSASGLARALTELRSVSQLWSTSYGQTLVVKSVLLLPLLGLGWLNRTRLLGAFARLRRSATVETVLLACVVTAVAVLVQLRPGKAEARRAAAVPVPSSPALPGRAAVVDAHGIGGVAVALARVPGSATVTLVGQDANGLNGRRVAIDGHTAAPCGSGCYRAAAGAGPVRVTVDSGETTFGIPARSPDATAQLREVTARYRGARTIVFDEKLSSTGRGGIDSLFTAVAPHSVAYQIRGGSSAVIIGARRWDRVAAGKPYVESPQSPVDATAPLWANVSNVRQVGPRTITFLDRSVPAWFRVTIGGGLPRVARMTAAAHFMVVRYVGFDVPVTVSPPSR